MNKYGCFSHQQYVPAITVFDGYTDKTRTRAKTKDVPNRMQLDCQYMQSESGGVDPKCNGCKHKGKM
jgi:hypothetical protein